MRHEHVSTSVSVAAAQGVMLGGWAVRAVARRLLAAAPALREELLGRRHRLHTRTLPPLAAARQGHGLRYLSLHGDPARPPVARAVGGDGGGDDRSRRDSSGDGDDSRREAWRGYPFSLGLLLAACWNGPNEQKVNEREFLLAAMVGNIERMQVGAGNKH